MNPPPPLVRVAVAARIVLDTQFPPTPLVAIPVAVADMAVGVGIADIEGDGELERESWKRGR